MKHTRQSPVDAAQVEVSPIEAYGLEALCSVFAKKGTKVEVQLALTTLPIFALREGHWRWLVRASTYQPENEEDCRDTNKFGCW